MLDLSKIDTLQAAAQSTRHFCHASKVIYSLRRLIVLGANFSSDSV